MSRMVISILIFVLMTAQAVAAPEGVADSEGTIHLGIKLGPSNVRNNPSGFGIYGGYTIFGPNTFTQNIFFSKLSIAAEGEYVDLGSSSAGARAAYKAAVFGMVGAATYPIDEQFAVIAKAGLASISHTAECLPAGCSSSTNTGLHGGIAGQFKFTPMMSLRAGYDFYPDGYSMMSASALYKF